MTDLARRSIASRLWERALDLIYPPRCVSCDSFGAFICDQCWPGMLKAEPPRCGMCWMPVQSPAEGPAPEPRCFRCRARPLTIKGIRSVFLYEGPARDAIHALKFRGLSAVAPTMAAHMAELLLKWGPPVQAIVPVPLAGHRRRTRGYDQAELLAKEISRLSDVPLARHPLRRKRATAPQTAQPGEDARRRNVADAFGPGSRIPTGGVLLIDDVITTGATLDACARVLISEGSGPVFALTFARED